jgi:DNA-directed RNA polymerase specialized sigma24 family protein
MMTMPSFGMPSVFGVTKNLMKSWLEHKEAKKRGGDGRPIPLQDVEFMGASAEPEPEFDQIWARHLLGLALQDLESQRPHFHQAVVLYLDGLDQKQIAERLSKSVTQVNNYLHRARQFLGGRVRELIREYSSSPEEFETELNSIAPLMKSP